MHKRRRKTLRRMEVPTVGKVEIRDDLRAYREAKGLVTAMLPLEPVPGTKAYTEITAVNWEDTLPLEALACIHDDLLATYPTEVLVVWGRRWTNGAVVAMVPQQEVTTRSVEWRDPEGMAWFDEFAEYLGTAHIHPGEDVDASSMDLQGWTMPNAGGVHYVTGRTRRYSIHASMGGRYLGKLESGYLPKTHVRVPIFPAQNRDFNDLVVEKKPILAIPSSRWEAWKRWIGLETRRGDSV